MRKVWMCEKCKSVYDEESYAEDCEEMHRTVDDMTLDWCGYGKSSDLWGTGLVMARKVPNKVRIKFSDDSGDFATYILERYGHKGI